jgi:hypothetical protein
MRFLTGAAMGVGAMYFLDPEQGNRRRAVVRHQARRTLEEAELAMGKACTRSSRGLSEPADARFRKRDGPITGKFLPDWG